MFFAPNVGEALDSYKMPRNTILSEDTGYIYTAIYPTSNLLTKLLVSPQGQLVLPVRHKKPFPTGLCCLTFGLVVFMSGLVVSSIYVYRYYFIPQVSSLWIPFP